MPLEWSPPAPPTKDVSSYDHTIAETPLGKIKIEWKGWKDDRAACGYMPWGSLVFGNTPEEAMAEAQTAWDLMMPRLAAFCSLGKLPD